ncbi:MAG: double-strand break repair protein AddB, partial [Methylocystis sp.]|nr:double-strand break repair protein AddB [Methylocystis sp.]
MRRNVFSIPAGVPFLATFVGALLDGEIVSGVARAGGPLELAKTTIYVPTRRSGRALAAEFAHAIDAPSALLPRILPLGGLEEQETAALFEAGADVSDVDDALPPAIEDIDRRLILAELVLRWARAVRHAIVSIDSTGQPELDARETLLIAASPASAYALAGDLGALIDEFIIENVDWSKLDRLTDGSYDKFWAITTHFLSIALKDWPRILAERGRIDGAARQVALIEAQMSRLNDDAANAPVIAIGSTGANAATAKLLGAIARCERGAVVLPGLDQDLDEEAWRRIGYASDDDGEPAFTHPQAALKRLLSVLGVVRDDVRALGAPAAELRDRVALAAQALRPADTTDQWRDYRASHGVRFTAALHGVTFVEAADEREEALALALLMREALETQGHTAALITPDRDIARRVAAELARWEIEIDDSGGRPLGATPIGSLARLIAQAAEGGLSAVDVAALLAHPRTRLGFAREEIARLRPLAEIGVLRVIGRGASGWAAMAAPARELAQDPHAHPAARRIGDDDWAAIETLLLRVDRAMAPLIAMSGATLLTERVRAHGDCLEAIVAGPLDSVNAPGEGVEQLLLLFDKLAGAQSSLAFDAGAYASLFD